MQEDGEDAEGMGLTCQATFIIIVFLSSPVPFPLWLLEQVNLVAMQKHGWRDWECMSQGV